MSRQLQYDKAALENAVKAVKTKTMGYLKASKVFHVPRSTIFDKVKGISDIYCSMGPHTVLTEAEEKRVVDWLIQMSQIGYGRTKYELIRTVAKIVKADDRKTPFKDGVPGKDWYYAFMSRHPEIKLRSPRQLGKERAVITPERVEEWFKDFKAYVSDTVEDKTILSDPTRLYNADESGFSLATKTGHVLGVRGAKSVYSLSASDKSQITVLCGMSAAAHFLRPMIVFPGQRFTRNMLDGFDDAVLGRSDNGWMDAELFASWLETVFIPDIQERHVKKPIILLVDGHSTHLSLEACDICRENGIILYCLLAHASHLMQPCDLRLFCSLKESWKAALRDWQVEHVGEYVTKFEFASIFKHAWLATTRVENAINGFRDAGLFPLDSSVVLKTDKFQTCTLFKTQNIDDSEKRKQESIDNHSGHDGEADKQNAPESTEALKENVNVTDIPVVASTSQSETSNQPTKQARESIDTDPSSSKPESPMSKYLKVPAFKQSEKKKVKREMLPKAVTSDQFRNYLLEKKKKKEDEEKAKTLRKEERERKKKEKLEAKKIKDEQRLQKKKKQEEKKSVEMKKKKQTNKRKYESSDDSDSDVNMSKIINEDDSDEFEEEFEMCPCCNKGDQHPSRWVKCNQCQTRWHFMCANRPEFELLDETERAKMDFTCPMCE